MATDAEWGADLVLAGHDHSYERLCVDGITYCVQGLGGNETLCKQPPTCAWLRSPTESTRFVPTDKFSTASGGRSYCSYNADLGAMRVLVTADLLALEFWNLAGLLVDRFEIQAEETGVSTSAASGSCAVPNLLCGFRQARYGPTRLYEGTGTNT